MTALKAIVIIPLIVAPRSGFAQTDRSACRTLIPVAFGASVAVLEGAETSNPHEDMVASEPLFGRTLSEMLTASIPGVSVMRSSGLAGTGSRVRLRGVGGLLTPRQPLLFIDGMRAEGELQSMLLDAGGQAPSRLDDLTVDDIACVQVLRGPATTARFGTDAAAGIISVVTRRSMSDSGHVSTFLEGGVTTDGKDYAANYGTVSPSPYGGCSRAQSALGTCTPGPIRSWSPLKADSPFRVAPLVNGGLHASISRGQRVSLGIHGRGTVSHGPFRRNTSRSYSTGATVDLRLGKAVNLETDLWLIGGYSSLPQTTGSNTLSILFAALDGASVDDPVRRGYRDLPLSALEEIGVEQRVRRVGGVARLQWTPGAGLALAVSVGREDSRTRDERSDPMFLVFQFPNEPDTEVGRFLGDAEQRGQRTNAAAFASWRYGLQSARLTTEVGVDYLDETGRRFTRTVSRRGELQSGTESWRATDPAVTGVLVRQAATVSDRFFVDAGLRRDHIDWEPIDLDDPTYRFGSIAWQVLRQVAPAHRRPSLRLRAAYGEGGDRRPFEAAIDMSGLIPVSPGPGLTTTPLRRVERTAETEVGIDVGLFADRATIGATYFNSRTSDALVTNSFAGSGGFAPIATSGASWRNKGTELALRARVVEARSVTAHVSINYSTLDNELLRLPPGGYIQGFYTRSLAGYPVFGLWSRPYMVRDVNLDGVIVPTEVVLATADRYFGSPVPARELGVAPSLVLRRSVRLAALIDYRGGFRSLNMTGNLRCSETCAERYVPNASLDDQARAVDGVDVTAGWIENASFVKVREVSISAVLPSTWTRRLGARSARFSVAGRNLATFTGYSGLDPEVSGMGQSRIDQQDVFTPPIPRTIVARLDLAW